MSYEMELVTLGERLKHVETGDLILTETRHPPAMTIPRHSHKHATISFTLAGQFVEVVGNTRYECFPSTLLIKPAGQVHENKYGETGAHSLIIEIKQAFLSGTHRSSVFDRPVKLKEGAGSSFATRIYKEFRRMDSVSPLAIEGLVLEMLAYGARAIPERLSATPPAWLLDAKDILDSRFAEQLSLSIIAADVGVHPSHLARVFRKHFHCSVGDYLRRQRLDHASRQLIQSDRSLVEIALEVGFFDHSHFANTFHSYLGMTPTQYRSLAKTKTK